MSRKNSLQALSIPSYRNFLGTRFFLTLSLQMQAVILGWEVYKLTSDPLSLGMVGLSEAIPAISVALYAGHIADIYNRKKILMISLAVMILSSIGMITSFSLSLPIQPKVYLIYAMIALNGLARGFYGPSTFAIISQLVPKDILAHAATLNSTIWQVAAVVGPALGGLIYGFAGLQVSFMLVILLACVAFLSLSRVNIRFEPKPPGHDSVWAKLREGVAYVYHNKIILSALSLDLFSVLFGGATALLPVFANEILHTGPEGLGILRAAPSLGAVVMMSWLSMRPLIHRAGKILIQAVAAFGLCMLFFGLSQNFYLSAFLLLLSGAFDSISVVVRSNILQLQTPDDMRGRVSAVNTIFIGSSNEIGAFESGVAAKLLGTATSVVFGACMTLVVVGITQQKAKQLKELTFNS